MVLQGARRTVWIESEDGNLPTGFRAVALTKDHKFNPISLLPHPTPTPAPSYDKNNEQLKDSRTCP